MVEEFIERFKERFEWDSGEYFEFNCCRQWVTKSDTITENCWIDPNGVIYPVKPANHSCVLAYLIYSKRITEVEDELDAEKKGWIKRSFGKWCIAKFPVSKKVCDEILIEFSEAKYIRINEKIFSSKLDFASIGTINDLSLYLKNGY